MSDVELPDWAKPLGMVPHPEGGWYVETYRSSTVIPGSMLAEHGGDRASATGIQFMLLPGEQSAWHRVISDELWLYTRGGRVALELGGVGDVPEVTERLVIGPDPSAGDVVQGLVPAGVWQRAYPLDAEPSLVSCIVTPGFDFADFELYRA
ncbi:cupin domain-containing protein [Dermatophilus congolensis]|uniref:cupin domain-containing protein n=1 Tax=Dermatophilus congolensis TaxID=1863 RepID=UPI001AAFC9DB|nr:cupin domain-containing protein [Dermatophilus congolensis]MBO3142534.1 cupin domain-containing protein [Dermatophilus congolensis]MBO3151524.1 cupin domain-containing protein [Dermatophilus congolensis]MBO3161474.1 cupin domain-containing protein [Dermatophilus congolensis]MBO3162809.1 cupin domain-containing protein [Dermatophilus congolensis]MBO3176363.1 cupin domain-containing protein [Dermatophilus congolensis]